MFFLLRMCFWLGLVLLLLPGITGGSSSHTPTGEPKVSPMEALSAASSAVADAGGFCSRQPQACAIGAGLIEMIGERAQAGAQFALAYISEQLIEEKRKAASRAAGAPAGDTLTTHDLSPAWQGPRLPASPSATGANTPPPSPVEATPGAPGSSVPLPPKRPA
ncbi:DUF5330 domain-containing protein [Ancylobacter sp. SL191]|uniref:DUF5330 domain-containing protein n=1 Tax=Ancylobacter sp. SL191 TaxID=2995166 RepID=UPI0022705115|nr:DUF5330 domain-containing protein [Ancylobacter sp. SL191]WAC27299.1 DUF5330 domain-containing protein [Ancylobacter sp. SL191]